MDLGKIQNLIKCYTQVNKKQNTKGNKNTDKQIKSYINGVSEQVSLHINNNITKINRKTNFKSRKILMYRVADRLVNS